MATSLRPRRFFALLTGVAAGAALLAACASDPQPGPPSAGAEATAESTTEPTPTPSDIEPAEWAIGFDGVGVFVVGDSLDDAVSGVSPPYAVAPASECPNPATRILTSDSSPTIWLQDAEGDGEVDVVAVGGDAPNDPRGLAAPRTESGVGIGSTLGDVEAAYPDGALDSDQQGQPSRFIVPGVGSSGEPRYLVFGIYEGSVQTILVQASSEEVMEFCG